MFTDVRWMPVCTNQGFSLSDDQLAELQNSHVHPNHIEMHVLQTDRLVTLILSSFQK